MGGILGQIFITLLVSCFAYDLHRASHSKRPTIPVKYFCLVAVVRDVIGIVACAMDGTYILGGAISIALLVDLYRTWWWFKNEDDHFDDDDDDDDDDDGVSLTEMGKKALQKAQNALQPVYAPLPQRI